MGRRLRALCKAVHQRRQQHRPERSRPARPTPRGEGAPPGVRVLSLPALRPAPPAAGLAFPSASVTGAPLAFCLPAPAAPASQQDPAPAAPEDHAQADVRGLRDRAVSGPSPRPVPSVPGVYLIGPVVSAIWGSGSSLRGVCSQPWDVRPSGVGSKVDAGLGRPGRVSAPGAASGPP